MATINMANKFSTKVDEKFSREALYNLVTNNDYEFNGVKQVDVYSIPVVPMNDYGRPTDDTAAFSSSRYGTAKELGNQVQHLVVKQDRSWTFTIDKMNKNQSQMVMDAGKAVSRQLSLKIIPEMDAYVFGKIAVNAGTSKTETLTKTTAYEAFLKAQETLGNLNVPDTGRIALVSYNFAGLMKQDPAFMRDCDTAQNMHIKGMLGEVDGVKIVRVPSSRLPAGCNFILTHPIACVAPKQLSEYRIHTDAPGISGWLCEGRIVYDAFVLDNKKDAIYYSGTSAAAEPTRENHTPATDTQAYADLVDSLS